MNKILSKLQKLICFTFVIGAALMIVGALLYFDGEWDVFTFDSSTNFYDNLRKNIRLAEVSLPDFKFQMKYDGCFSYVFETPDLAKNFYNGLWDSIQLTNNLLFYTGLLALAGIAVCGVLGHFGHRKYYKSNLISGLVVASYSVVMSLATIVSNLYVMGNLTKTYPDIDNFNYVKELYSTSQNEPFDYINITTKSGFIAIVIPVIFIVICVLFAIFTVNKYIQSRKQNRMEACLDE